MAKSPSDVLKMAKEAGVKIVDFRFIDLFGTWQHTSNSINDVDEDTFSDGVGFDGVNTGAGQGLENMRLRAKSIDGGFAFRSHPGRGTAFEVVLRA